MFRPVFMVRVEIFLLQRDLAMLSRELARARILHLGKATIFAAEKENREHFESRERIDEYRNLELILVRTMREMGVETSVVPLTEQEDILSKRPWIEDLDRSVRGVLRRKEELSAAARNISEAASFLRPLSGIRGNVEEVASLRFICMRLGFLPVQRALSAMAIVPEGISAASIDRSASGEEVLAAFMAPSSQKEALERFLGEIRLRQLAVPAGLHGTFPEELRRSEALLDRIRKRMKHLDIKLEEWKKGHGDLLRRYLGAVRAEIRLLELRSDFGFTERTAIIGGWIPEKRIGELKKLLQKTCGDMAILRESPASGIETPVLLINSRLIRPFQKILAVYGTPAYDELEPTPLLAIGFLLIFGMMFGDIGHGLVLAAAGLYLRSKTRFRDEGLIVAEVGGFAILFGVLFGSFFGNEHLFPALWFSPMENITRLMLAALALGVGLILTALSMRVWNGIRQGDKSVLFDRYGLAGLIFYGGALVTGYLVFGNILPMEAILWLAAPLLAILFHPLLEQKGRENVVSPAVALTEGLVEVLETVLGFVTNTLSFLRIAAFGLAHVGLSMAVFAVADEVRSAPLGGLWVGLVYVGGHILILLLEGLVVSVQTVRLEFYEVFSKFFQGGGVSYSPLSFDSLPERRR